MFAWPQGGLPASDRVSRRVLETALAALAFEYIMLLPETGEVGAGSG